MDKRFVETFFADAAEYYYFLVNLKARGVLSEEPYSTAILTQREGRLHCEVSAENRAVSDFVKVFPPTPDNIRLFNEGCRILSERLAILIRTGDRSSVPDDPPAFGRLTWGVDVDTGERLALGA